MHPKVTDSTKEKARMWSSVRMVAVVALLPLLTGFDYEQPRPQSASPTRIVSAPQTVQQATEEAASVSQPESFNWRASKNTEDGVTELPGPAPLLPAAAPGDASSAPLSPRKKIHSWETGANKSYLIPAVEIPTFLVALNIRNRFAYDDPGNDDYDVTFSSIWRNVKRQNWTYDVDPFNTNQFAHPYQGAVMFGMARTSGLGFWESTLYSNVGSFAWELAGETDDPSTNDMATTGTSGSLLGEALFRMSALVLKEGGARPDFWHELGAAVVYPPTGLNRLLFGQRFKSVYPVNDPATFWRFRLGAALSGDPDLSAATADFGMAYGLPGKPGYTYKRPLDYFDFQISGLAQSGNPVEIVLLRGLLYGEPYAMGDDYRGIWGLYGSYDFISPGTFRVSNTALSLGSTAQYWLSRSVALQGSLLGGLGFGAGGNTEGTGAERTYHYGITPQATLALRLLFSDRVLFETVGRGYIVSGTGSDDAQGSERIARITANLNIRVWKRHGIGFGYVKSVRDAHYGNLPSTHQSDGTVSLVYTFLADTRFGAVEWRNPGDK